MDHLPKPLQRLLGDLHQIRIALLLLVLYATAAQLLFHTICPFAILSGLPCPACGLTRAGILLLTGKPAAAAQTNAMIFLWAPFLLYLCILRYFIGKRAPFSTAFAILICLGTLFYYVLRMSQGNPVPMPNTGILRPGILSICLDTGRIQ